LDWDKEKRLLTAKGGGAKCINPKCGSDITQTVTAQIRSADEPMTELINLKLLNFHSNFIGFMNVWFATRSGNINFFLKNNKKKTIFLFKM